MCGGKDRYRWDDREGRGTWFCSHCGSGDGFGLLQAVRGWDFKTAAREVERVVGVVPASVTRQISPEFSRELLNRVWAGAAPLASGDIVTRYLASRGLASTSRDLRCHSGLEYREDGKVVGTYPAMVALVRDMSGKPVTIHRTYLSEPGTKAAVGSPRKIMPAKAPGGPAIRLFPVGSYLGIAEGIETALAASVRFGLPVWSSISAHGMEVWEPPAGVKGVVIFGDNDASFTGQAAAFALAKRLAGTHSVEIRLPSWQGDWNDRA